VVFDLGNVLIPFNYQIMINKLEVIELGLGQRFVEYYQSHYEIHRNFEKGLIEEEDFINLMLETINYKIDGETFCKYYSEIFTINENVIELLPILKEKYKLVLLSNTNGIHKKYGWENYSFINYFDKLILSHEVKAVKPERAIYLEVEKYTCRPSEEHIFIDDVLEYVEGAKNMGWDGIQFLGYDFLVEQLKVRNLL
ncbi:MAG: HAD family phosphatase, partial [Ignavibacteriaceae bacterium]|nr:HAD family phosphatase [Ignavibacteriaceae bacterium]